VLRKGAARIRLQTQPLEILGALLENPGAVVTREELRRRLWPEDTFVDFEHGLNAGVTRLRQALGDSAAQPRYIETLAKRGYRFCADVEGQWVGNVEHSSTPAMPPKRRFVVWIAGIALLAACTGAFLSMSRKADAVVGQAVPLTTFRGMEIEPALSPDGNQVAFAWNGEREDNFDVYVMRIPDGSPVRLTSDPTEDASPAWSPDGRTIAFLRKLGGDRAALYLVPAGGGPEHRLREIVDVRFRSQGRLVSLSWSPDGRWIAASHRASEHAGEGLHLFSLNGEDRQLTFPQGYLGDHMPAFSPDGRSLAFCRLVGGSASEIYLLPLKPDFTPGGAPRRLTAHNRMSMNPTWGRSGRTVLYRLFGELRAIDVKAEDASSWSLPLSGVSGFCVGRYVVYSQRTDDTNIWRVKLPVAGDTPSPPELFISSTRQDDIPRYSPDGKKIAFRSTRSGSDEIWVSKADGTSAVHLTSVNGALIGIPNWSPDGQSIVFHARPEGQADVYVIPAAGGAPKRLTDDPFDDTAASYSRDGRWIYFTATRSGQAEIWKMPATGGKAVQLTFTGGARPIESVDGRKIYYRSDRVATEIMSIPVDGGQPVWVAGPTHEFPYDFTVTAEGLYYPAPPDSDGLRSILFLDFATGRTRRVAVAKHAFILGISVSPDARYLLFDQVDESRSDLMLVRDFRIP